MPDLPADTPLDERVKAALRTIFDPELPVNIYDLGLIYEIAVSPESDVAVDMTLTSPACPVAGSLVGEAAVGQGPDVGRGGAGTGATVGA